MNFCTKISGGGGYSSPYFNCIHWQRCKWITVLIKLCGCCFFTPRIIVCISGICSEAPLWPSQVNLHVAGSRLLLAMEDSSYRVKLPAPCRQFSCKERTSVSHNVEYTRHIWIPLCPHNAVSHLLFRGCGCPCDIHLCVVVFPIFKYTGIKLECPVQINVHDVKNLLTYEQEQVQKR